ncbi:hypothetical protein ACFE04_028747 [Oxalis oulophora]
MGLACHIAEIHSEQYIEELYWGSGKRVMLLGHSKGGFDAAGAALSLYWPELKDKVVGLAFVQSPYGGTPVASDILRDGQISEIETRRIMELLICKVIKSDNRALEDLTYDRRKEFIMKHKLPDNIPFTSFHSEANISASGPPPGSHGSPFFCGNGCMRSLPTTQIGRKINRLVTCRDAEIPGSVIVRPEQKLDHAWMLVKCMRRF